MVDDFSISSYNGKGSRSCGVGPFITFCRPDQRPAEMSMSRSKRLRNSIGTRRS